MDYFILKENILLWFIQPSILPKTNITQQVFLFGPFSCEAHDSQKDIFEGNQPPQNLDFKKQKWNVILNISNKILKKNKRIKRVKSNIFHVIIVAI